MAIDHLLFDRLKWVKDSDHVKNYVGLRLTKDVSIERYTFHSDGKIYKYQGDPERPFVDADTLLTGDQVDREVVDGKEIYIRTYNTPKGTSLYKVSDILQNGGVSHSAVTYVYHAVSRFRKEISMVDHLLFDRSKWIKDLVGTSVTVPTNINLYKSYGDDVKKIKSYTGKNTVCRVLAKRIYCAVEIDGQTYYIKPQDLIGGVLRRLKSLLYQWKQVVLC